MHAVTLEEIHRDPAILDRALKARETVEIRDHGKLAGTLVPAADEGFRRSGRGFPISKGRASFGAADVARLEREVDSQ